jgi:hypothetical protein
MVQFPAGQPIEDVDPSVLGDLADDLCETAHSNEKVVK